MRKEIDRFMEKVSIGEDRVNSCWEWNAAKYRGGYGHFRKRVDGLWKMYKAHRFSYEYFKGPIGPSLVVCHTCDNPSCVNPNHLFTGTMKQNVEDMHKKGRFKFGRNKTHNNLTKETALQIREDYSKGIRQKELSNKYKCSPSQVCRIVNRKIWK